MELGGVGGLMEVGSPWNEEGGRRHRVRCGSNLESCPQQRSSTHSREDYEVKLVKSRVEMVLLDMGESIQ